MDCIFFKLLISNGKWDRFARKYNGGVARDGRTEQVDVGRVQVCSVVDVCEPLLFKGGSAEKVEEISGFVCQEWCHCFEMF